MLQINKTHYKVVFFHEAMPARIDLLHHLCWKNLIRNHDRVKSQKVKHLFHLFEYLRSNCDRENLMFSHSNGKNTVRLCIGEGIARIILPHVYWFFLSMKKIIFFQISRHVMLSLTLEYVFVIHKKFDSFASVIVRNIQIPSDIVTFDSLFVSVHVYACV